MTRKQRIVSKWRLEPEKRNPAVVALWCGLEVSLCTRNARRRRLIQLLGSETLSRYSKHSLFKWHDLDCQLAFQQALEDEDPEAFTGLYLQHEEWRPDIGRAISLLFDALGSSGVMLDGNLEAFVFVEDSNDPEQVAVFPRDKHTWVNFLKDTVMSATFAMASNTCLSFPHRNGSGQRCRGTKAAASQQHTILQTAVVPATSGDLDDEPTWSSNIPEGKCLVVDDLKSSMLRLIYRLPNGHLILRWSDSEWARAAVLKLPGSKDIVRFREFVEDTRFEKNTAAVAYIISKYPNALPPSRRSTVANPSTTTLTETVTRIGNPSTLSVASADKSSLANSNRHPDAAEEQVPLKNCTSTLCNGTQPQALGLGEETTRKRQYSGKGKQKQFAHVALPGHCDTKLEVGSYYAEAGVEDFQWHPNVTCDAVVEPPQQIRRIR